jgi:hypothetical protein
MGKFKPKTKDQPKQGLAKPENQIFKKKKNSLVTNDKKKLQAENVQNNEVVMKVDKINQKLKAKNVQTSSGKNKTKPEKVQNSPEQSIVNGKKKKNKYDSSSKSPKTEKKNTKNGSEMNNEKKSKKKKAAKELAHGDDFTEAMRKELEVFIKNLNRDGQIQKAFVVDDDSVEKVDENDDVDDVSVDENYEDMSDSDDDDEVEGEEEVAPVVVEEKTKTKKEKAQDRKETIKKEERKKETTSTSKNPVIKEEEASVVKEEEKLERADYIFVKEVRKERLHCLLRPKAGEPWYKIIEKKNKDGEDASDEDEDEDGVETSQYWLMKIEKFAKKLLDEELANFKNQVTGVNPPFVDVME